MQNAIHQGCWSRINRCTKSFPSGCLLFCGSGIYADIHLLGGGVPNAVDVVSKSRFARVWMILGNGIESTDARFRSVHTLRSKKTRMMSQHQDTFACKNEGTNRQKMGTSSGAYISVEINDELPELVGILESMESNSWRKFMILARILEDWKARGKKSACTRTAQGVRNVWTVSWDVN